MCNTLNDFFASVFTKESQDKELPEVETRFNHDSCCMLEHSFNRKIGRQSVKEVKGWEGTRYRWHCAQGISGMC
jgi:hypothetical protein